MIVINGTVGSDSKASDNRSQPTLFDKKMAVVI